jgi:hypothetical protein
MPPVRGAGAYAQRRMIGFRWFLALCAVAAAAFLLVLAGGTSSGQQQGPARGEDLTTLRCFGAASRDPEHPCFNRALKLSVVPTPAEAKLGQNSACTPSGKTDELYPCLFATPEDEAKRNIALVGDSHAGHWRAALEVVATRRRWHGVSLTQTGCPMTRATPILRGVVREDCLEWNEALVPFFERHPEIETVFVSQHGAKVVVPFGRSPEKIQRQGFRDAFRALPRTVKRIVVIRGTPWSSASVPGCVDEAVAAGERPDVACRLLRRRALRPDYAAQAAATMRDKRVSVVNLTPHMCGRKYCYPVVGGALVHKDGGHITQVFSRTLGPYLGRAIDRLDD